MKSKFDQICCEVFRWLLHELLSKFIWIQVKFCAHRKFRVVKMGLLSIKVVTAGPNEALIVSGFLHEPPTLIVGGRAFFIPWLQKIQKLQLNTMTLVLKTEQVYTNRGVPLSMTGIAQVNEGALRTIPLTLLYTDNITTKCNQLP